MPRKKAIVIELAGGLGNQLFQYFAGFYIADQLGKKLKIDVRFAQYTHSKHDISAFVLPGEFLRDSNSMINRSRKFQRRLSDAFFIRIPSSVKFNKFILRRHYFDSGESADQIMQRAKDCYRITGYFANKLFILELQKKSKFLELELRNPSIWYQNIEAKAKRISPVMVHIRRGDYISNSKYYGLLSEKYYEKIISELPLDVTCRGVWVFCDQPEQVKGWDLWEKYEVTFVNEADSPKADPAEFLKLMTHAKYLIMANSSFSYFAGMFNQNKAVIFCPDPPLKGSKSNSELIYPEDWLRVQSEWA